jgi:hypothetical protein
VQSDTPDGFADLGVVVGGVFLGLFDDLLAGVARLLDQARGFLLARLEQAGGARAGIGADLVRAGLGVEERDQGRGYLLLALAQRLGARRPAGRGAPPRRARLLRSCSWSRP